VFLQSQSPVPEWSVQQVGRWLAALDLASYVPLFGERRVDGQELLSLDNNKLKVQSLLTDVSSYSLSIMPWSSHSKSKSVTKAKGPNYQSLYEQLDL
jgi:hypothetical protein